MIFPTLDERNRVYEIIEKQKDFPDLKPDQMAEIKGYYRSMKALESLMNNNYTDSETLIDKLRSEIACDTINECIGALTFQVAEAYISFIEMNESEDN